MLPTNLTDKKQLPAGLLSEWKVSLNKAVSTKWFREAYWFV